MNKHKGEMNDAPPGLFFELTDIGYYEDLISDIM